MSKKETILILSSPYGIQPRGARCAGAEFREVFRSAGHVCGYCQGSGRFWETDEEGDDIQKDCPVCKGSGKLDAVVTVEWTASEK